MAGLVISSLHPGPFLFLFLAVNLYNCTCKVGESQSPLKSLLLSEEVCQDHVFALDIDGTYILHQNLIRIGISVSR